MYNSSYKKFFTAIFVVSTFFTNGVLAQDTINLDLDESIKIALQENPVIKVAGDDIALKKVSRTEAIQSLFPDASLIGNYSRTIEKQTFAMKGDLIKVGTDNVYSGGLSVNLPIYAPALYKSISLTKSDVELAIEKSRASKLDLINQVKKAFYQLLLAQDSYSVLLKSYNQSVDNYNVVKEKFEQGMVSEYDKITAEVQMRNLNPSVVSSKNAITLSNLQLKVLLGLDDSVNISVKGNLKDYENEVFEKMASTRSFGLSENSTMKQFDLNAEILKKNLSLQNANFLPTIGANFQYNYVSMNDNFKFKDYIWNPYSTLGVNVTIPLYKASNFTKVKKTKIQIKQLEENRINTKRQLTTQISNYLNNMSASTEQLVSNKEAIYQAEKGRMIAEKRYEVGKGTVLELNNSEVALTQSKLTYNQSIFDYLTAQADLDLVLGNDEFIK